MSSNYEQIADEQIARVTDLLQNLLGVHHAACQTGGHFRVRKTSMQECMGKPALVGPSAAQASQRFGKC